MILNNTLYQQIGREKCDERTQVLSMLENFEKQEEKLKKELQRYRDSDPEYIAQLKTETEVHIFVKV